MIDPRVESEIKRLEEEIRKLHSLIQNASPETKATGIVQEWQTKIQGLIYEINSLKENEANRLRGGPYSG